MILRLFQFIRRPRWQIRADVDDEVRFHLETRVDELVAGGRTREDATRQATLEFGDADDARRYMRRLDRRTERATRRRDYMGEFRQDIRYALRHLRRSPAFATTAIVTLALGIGANTAIFSLVNGVLFRPLPFHEPDRLYAVYSANRTAGIPQGSVSAVDLDDWRASRQRIDDLGGYLYAEGSTGIDLTGRGPARRLSAVFITAGFLPALGVTPVEGRFPREEELVRGGPDRIVVLTHGFWMREFGGERSVVGSSLTLNGAPYEVLGVLPASARVPTGEADVFVPSSTIPDYAIPRIRQVRTLTVIARARPDASRETVQAEMNTIAGRLAQQYPEDRAWDTTTVVPLHEVITGPVRRGLLVLLGGVGFVLLTACVNVASLQLARAVSRRREMGVRIALGARRGRLVRQMLTESLVLASFGCVAGLVLARLIVDGLLALGTTELPRAAEVRLDAGVLAFSVALSIVTAFLSGVVPALKMASADAQPMLRAGGRGAVGGDSQRLRSALVVAEVALAVVLVVGAGLMIRSFASLLTLDPGFRADHLIAVQFTIDTARYPRPAPPPGSPTPPPPAPAPYTAFYTAAIEKTRTLPGVISAAAVKDPPLRGNGERNGFRIPNRPVPAGQDPPLATAIHVSDGYFATIGAKMAGGREFTPHDRVGAPFVVVVNEAFARQFFPGQTTVGQTLIMGRDVPVEIIGVVGDIRQVSMAEPARPTMYLHNLQNFRVKTTIVARTVGDPLEMAGAIRAAIASIDPLQSITAVFTFDEAVSRALTRPRLLTVLLGAFGALGLGLGAIGLYGVLAFLVNQRRREIGVRFTLGAQPRDVRWMFMRRGLALTGIGLVIGLACALALSQTLVSVLYGVTPNDPFTFASVALILVIAAAAASWLPARRAARVDPIEILRAD